jgi:hypothetical protein
LEDPGADEEYSSEVYLQKLGYMGMDWIVLVEARDRWRQPVNAIMKLRFP